MKEKCIYKKPKIEEALLKDYLFFNKFSLQQTHANNPLKSHFRMQ